MTEVIHDFPAYKLIKPVRSYYTDGDTIALPYEANPARRTARNSDLFRFFKFGSVAVFSARCGLCPEAALAESRQRGHKIWWLNQQATVITSHHRPQETHPLHEFGDEIRFHGRTFRIDPDHNGNAKLTEVEAA